MEQPRLLALLLLPLLPVILLGVATDPAVTKSFQFRQDPVCPPPAGVAAAMKLQGVHSRQTCSIECILRANCAVYNFASASAECQMGSTADLLNNWTTSAGTPCVSQLNPRLPGILTFRDKLLAFLDFRIGQDNLVGSDQFKVVQSSSGVTFTPGVGAEFAPLQSGVSNYIELKKDGGVQTIGSLLGRGKNFSVYARVNRLAGVEQWFFMLSDCSSYDQWRGGMVYFNNRTAMFHSLASPNEIKFRQSVQPVPDPIGSTNVDSSMGVVFSNNDFTAAFINGSLTAIEPLVLPAGGSPTYSGVPDCIRLGYWPDPNKGLVGRYICFVIINATLTAAEFAELEALCS